MKKILFFAAILVIAAVSSAQTIVFHENFDPSSNADSLTASGTANFTINTRLYSSSPQCDSLEVPMNGICYLTSSSFSTIGSSNVMLQFSHICKIEIFDTAKIEVSVNGGVTWVKLTTQYINPGDANWSTQGYRFSANTYSTLWVPGTPTLKPQQNWWRNEIFDISTLAANQSNVRIRFTLIDGDGDGTSQNMGWYLDDVKVSGAISELFPPKLIMKPPILQDTVFSTGPFDIYAYIQDASGIDTAYLQYQLNGGAAQYIPMLWVSDSTYKATIPSYSYNNRIDYKVFAFDNSLSHNSATSANLWFYTKKSKPFVVVGTGTSTTNYLPIYGYYNYSWGAMVYLKTELNFSGNIDSIGFYVGNTPTAYAMLNQKVFIGHTSSTTYGTSQPDTSTMTVIYSGTCTFNGTDWYKIAPQTPFYYNGSDNLLIYWVNKDGSYASGYPQFRYTSTSPNYLGAYKYNDTYSNVFPTSVGTQAYERPNLRIKYTAQQYTQDAGVSQMLTPTGSLLTNVDYPVTLKIKNFASDSLKKVTIAWSVDGALQTPYNWTGVLLQDIVSNTINIGNANVSTVGTHIVKAWTELPNNSTDQNHINDTASISFFACTAQLSGVYTVGGAGADFVTLADALTGLNNCGIGGPTTFKINSGTYTEQLTLNQVSGASAVNTITFMPNTGATVVITSSSTSGTIKLNGADYIIFNGSNNGTTTRDMTITNTSTAGSAAIWMASAGTGLGCKKNVIKNCNINAGANTSGIYGIMLGGATLASAGADNDSILIQNNSISKAYVGIWAQGAASPGIMDNLQIIGNSIGSAIPANYLGHDGVIVANGNACNIQGNTIFNIVTTNTTPVGLTISTGFVSSSVTKNKISNIVYTGTSGYGARGMYVNTGNATSNLTIANNFISVIGGDGYSSFSATSPVGMYFDGTTGGLNIYYNSVYMSGNLTYNAATLTAAILFNSTTITGINLKNNIFQNSMNNTVSATAKNYAIYSTAPGTSFTSINNNDYYVSGIQGVLGYLGTAQATLAAWQTATGQDANSVNVAPTFISTSDLHTFASSVNNIATPIAGITDDIDGELRNAVNPDMGADEFTPLANDLGILSVISPVSICGLGATENVTIQLINAGGAAITTADLYYVLNGGTPVHGVFNGNVGSDSIFNYTFTQTANLSASGNYTFKFYVALAGDANQLNDTISNYTISNGWDLYSSAYTMGFEPTDNMSLWTILDVNADTYTWTFPYSGSAHTGAKSARLYTGGATGNDWLFSRCFNLVAGSTYKIEFWYMAGSASYAQNVDLFLGNNNTPAAMVTPLVSLPSFINTTYQKATVNFLAATTGTYYFGWYGHSTATSSYAYIDDINLSILPEQEVSLLSMTEPASGCGLSTAEPVTILIKNSGADTINGNLNASYKLVGGSTITEPVTTTILPDSTLAFTFATPVNVAVTTQDSIFAFKSWVKLVGDPIHFNDTINAFVNSSYVPAAPTVVSDTVPYGGIANLQATSADILNWYGVPSGGTILGTGPTFTTPNLYTTTTYYVEAVTPGGTTSWNFNTDLQGWTVQNPCSSSNNWAWNADAGNGALFAVDPSASSYQLITSPSVFVAGASSVTLSFNHHFATESCCDEGYVAYKLDNGPWTQFTPTVNTYTGSHNIDNDPLNSCVSTTKNSFYGTQATMITSSGSINTGGATNIQIAFVFTSDGSVSGTGWYINEVTLNGGSGGCSSARVAVTAFVELVPYEASVVSMPSPVDQCTNGAENVTIRIRNNGLNTINGALTAKYTINGSAPVVEPVTSTILPTDTLTFTFATPFTAGLTPAKMDSVYNIKAYIELTGDNYYTNDTTNKSVTLLYTPPVPVVSNISIPYGTTGTLNAFAVDSVYWYNVPTGGTELLVGSSYTTPILYGTTVYYAATKTGASDLKITEVTHYSGGTGATSPYPAWCSGADLIEITNLGGASIDLQNYTMNIYGEGARSYTIPSVTLNAGEIMVLCAGTGTDSPANRYFNMGGSNDVIQSSSLSGFALKDPTNVVVDAVASNGYTFLPADGVTATDWSGSISGMSGFAGSIRIISDNNVASDWIISSATNLQTMGSLNPALPVGSGSACESARVPDTVFVTGTPACDVSIDAIITPNSGLELTNAELVKIRVKNYGTTPATNIPVHYVINGGTPVNEIVPGPIATNNTMLFTFATPADLSVVGTYNFTVYTNLSCDATLVNDTAHKTVVNSLPVYCSAVPSNTSDEEIFSVTVNGATNAYDCNTVAPGPGSLLNRYSNFTTLPPLTTLSIGATVPFTILEDECDGLTYYSNGCAIWIDYNRDGDFTDQGEQVYVENTTTLGPRTITGTFTVPTGCHIGITTMRIIVSEGSSGSALQPCMTYSYGETEDYNIRILPPIPHDAGVIAFVQPTSPQSEGASVPVQVTVKNFGTDTIKNSSNMTVAYSYNGGAAQSITWIGGNIVPLGTATATLPNFTVLPNDHSLCAWTILTGDSNTFNDTTCMTLLGNPQTDAGITQFLKPNVSLSQGAVDSVKVRMDNFGVDTLTSLNVVYKINGVVQATQAWTGTLLPGGFTVVTFNQAFTVPASSFSVCAYTSLVTDANHSNDTLCMNSYGVFTSPLPYYDDFDGATVMWEAGPVSNGTIWELGSPSYGVTNNVHSAPNAWDVNLSTAYNNSATAYLYTQNFDFTGIISAKMKFWLNYYVETNYDGLRLEYTKDAGATWTTLGILSDPKGVNWYNDDVIISSGLPGWTTASSGWKKSEYKLDTLNNTPVVRFRFVFTSDASGTYDGFSLDDFSITVPSPKDAGVELIKAPTVQAPAGSNKVVKVLIHNYGTDTLYSIPVSYVANMGLPVSGTWTGTLAPDDTTTYQFTTLLTIPSGAFSLCSYTGLANDGEHLNDTTCSTLTGVPTFMVPYSDNFESTIYFFGDGSGNLWEYGTPTATTINAAHSPTHAWATNLDGYYVNNAADYLYTPYFMFTGVDSAYLEFWHWYQTESNYDGGRVEYSINGGAWTVLGTQGDANAVNWYNSASPSACWSGSSGGYVYSKYRLNAIPAIVNAPTPVQFRFKFFSNASNSSFDGWAVDDFAITAPAIPTDAGVIAITAPTGATQTGSQVTVSVTLKNFGTNTLTSVPLRYVVNGGAVTAETWSGTMAPGATAPYTFTTHYASPGTTYELCAFTGLSGDIYTFNDTTCASFGTTPAPHDVGVTAILAPGTQTIYGQADTVKIRIKNYGLTPETSIPVVYTRNGVQVGAGIWTGTLNAGDSTEYTFATPSISPNGNYVLCARTNMTGDANTANNEKCMYAVGIVGIETYDYTSFVLDQNMPNPAANNTTIVFYVPENGKVYFEMVDILGQIIYSKDINAIRGKNQIDLDANNLRDGIYFYTAEYKGEKQTKRMVVNK